MRILNYRVLRTRQDLQIRDLKTNRGKDRSKAQQILKQVLDNSNMLEPVSGDISDSINPYSQQETRPSHPKRSSIKGHISAIYNRKEGLGHQIIFYSYFYKIISTPPLYSVSLECPGGSVGLELLFGTRVRHLVLPVSLLLETALLAHLLYCFIRCLLHISFSNRFSQVPIPVSNLRCRRRGLNWGWLLVERERVQRPKQVLEGELAGWLLLGNIEREVRDVVLPMNVIVWEKVKLFVILLVHYLPLILHFILSWEDLLIKDVNCFLWDGLARFHFLFDLLPCYEMVFEELDSLVDTLLRSVRVVIPRDDFQVLLASIGFVVLFGMVWAHQLIIHRCYEEPGGVDVWGFFDRVEFVEIELGLVFNCVADNFHQPGEDEHRYFAVLLAKIFNQSFQAHEGRVKHCCLDRIILLQVHQRGHRPHGPPPQSDPSHRRPLLQILYHLRQILPLVPPQRDILPLRVPAPREIERQQRYPLLDQLSQVLYPLCPITTISMEIHHTRVLLQIQGDEV